MDELIGVATDPNIEEVQKHELNVSLIAKYEQLAMVRDVKALDLVRYYKNCLASEKAIADEIKNLTDRKKAWGNKAESIKNFIAGMVEKGEKLEDGSAKISWRKSESVYFDEMRINELPKECIKVVESVNKTELKKYIKANGETDFYHIEQKQNIQLG